MRAADEQRVAHRVIDLRPRLAHIARPKLVADDDAGGGVELHHPVAAHQGPVLADQPALAEERTVIDDLQGNGGLPDDAVAGPPLQRVDGAGDAALRHRHLEDDAVVGGIVGEPTGRLVEARRTRLDLAWREGGDLFQLDTDRRPGERIETGGGGDAEPVEGEAGVAGGGAAAEQPALADTLGDKPTDDTPHPRFVEALAGAPDIAHVIGTQQADIVEGRAGEQEVDPAVRAHRH